MPKFKSTTKITDRRRKIATILSKCCRCGKHRANKANAKGVDPEQLIRTERRWCCSLLGPPPCPGRSANSGVASWPTPRRLPAGFQFDATDRWLSPSTTSTQPPSSTLRTWAALLLSWFLSTPNPHNSGQLWQNGVTGTSIVPTIAFDQLSEEEGFKIIAKTSNRFAANPDWLCPVQPTNVRQFIEKYGIKLCQAWSNRDLTPEHRCHWFDWWTVSTDGRCQLGRHRVGLH